MPPKQPPPSVPTASASMLTRQDARLAKEIRALLDAFAPSVAQTFADDEDILNSLFPRGPGRALEVATARVLFSNGKTNSLELLQLVETALRPSGKSVAFLQEAEPRYREIQARSPAFGKSPARFVIAADDSVIMDTTATKLTFTTPGAGGGSGTLSTGGTAKSAPKTISSGGTPNTIATTKSTPKPSPSPSLAQSPIFGSGGSIYSSTPGSASSFFGFTPATTSSSSSSATSSIGSARGGSLVPGGQVQLYDAMRAAVGDALADSNAPHARDNLDDEPWENTHPRIETPRLQFGGALLNSAAMRPGLEAMPDAPNLGNRGLFRGDIINQPRLRFEADQRTSVIERPDAKVGDQIVDSKRSMDRSKDTLRTLFGEANAEDVIPSKHDQIQSDIMFDSFSTVLPGWGLGMNNKMFLMEEEHEDKIIGAAPMSWPRQDIGPLGGSDTMPVVWKSSISEYNRRKIRNARIKNDMLASLLEQRVGNGSLNILGDDAGFLRSISDRGLPRDKESCLEPVVITSAPWKPAKVPCGYDLRRVKMRVPHDALRMPAKIRPTMAQNGGSTYPNEYAYTEMYNAPAMG